MRMNFFRIFLICGVWGVASGNVDGAVGGSSGTSDDGQCGKDKSCRFKSGSYSLNLLNIIDDIIMNEIVSSIVQCAEKCRDKSEAKFCAFSPPDNRCYGMDREYDDVDMARIMEFDWIIIYIRESDGRMFIREKAPYCNRDFCKETCLPGYFQRCVLSELIGGNDCDEFIETAILESCKQLQDLTVFGRGQQDVIYATNKGLYTPKFIQFAGLRAQKMTCHYSYADATPHLMVAPVFLDTDLKHDNPNVARREGDNLIIDIALTVPDDVIDAMKSLLQSTGCWQTLTFDLHLVARSSVKLLGWDRTVRRFDSMELCHLCDWWQSTNYYPYFTATFYEPFIPFRAVIIENFYLNPVYARIRSHYFYCKE